MNATILPPSLEARWEALRRSEPQLRIREAAARLGASEAGLLSLMLGRGVRRLRSEPGTVLSRLAGLGSMMALTRNDGAVHERHGRYDRVEVQGNVGLVNNPDIDLRLDFSVWSQAYAEVKIHAGRTLRSLQFFDGQGQAVHKIYLDEEDQAAAWEVLVAEFLHEDQTQPFAGGPALTEASPSAPTPAEAVRQALVEAWSGLKDPHHFHGMLRKQKLARREAFSAAEGRFTRRTDADSLMKALSAAASQAIPIMVFVGNAGCIQIHTGLVNQIKPLGRWVNVLDPDFNLHVDLDQVAEAWVVEKPSPDGTVTSLEYLDSQGGLILQVFGERKPGKPELTSWKTLAGQL